MACTKLTNNWALFTKYATCDCFHCGIDHWKTFLHSSTLDNDRLAHKHSWSFLPRIDSPITRSLALVHVGFSHCVVQLEYIPCWVVRLNINITLSIFPNLRQMIIHAWSEFLRQVYLVAAMTYLIWRLLADVENDITPSNLAHDIQFYQWSHRILRYDISVTYVPATVGVHETELVLGIIFWNSMNSILDNSRNMESWDLEKANMVQIKIDTTHNFSHLKTLIVCKRTFN